MPKIRLDDLDGYRPSKEKVQRRKKENYVDKLIFI